MLITTMIVYIGCKKQGDGDVRVTTYTPQDITQTSAKCGGDVVTQGLSLDELGVCWSTENNPTVEDAHISTTNGSSTFVCTITGLEPDTKYHVRAYALRDLEYYYGEDKSFTTMENDGGGGENDDDHAYVDLGLPSGTLWATCNVGAELPEDYGNYFAWGEVMPKTAYNWSTYKYCNGSYTQLTKYCNNSNYGYNGFTDNMTVLLSEDDAATANWGNGWCMPTKEQWQELKDNTVSVWATQNGVNGRLLTASNGQSLFLPAGGSCWSSELVGVSFDGDYWSSSFYMDFPGDAWYFGFSSNDYGIVNYRRDYGASVRAVRSSR